MTQEEQIRQLQFITSTIKQDYEVKYSKDSSLSFLFINISNSDEIRMHYSIPETLGMDIKYTIVCLRCFYNEYGRRVDMFQPSILDHNLNQFINEFRSSKWRMFDITWLANVSEDLKIIGQAKFKLVEAPLGKGDEVLTLEFDFNDAFSFEDLWSYFLEVDEYCVTGREAKLYLSFFKEKKCTKNLSLTMNEYKEIIDEKTHMLKSYGELLDGFKALLCINQTGQCL